MKFIFFFIVFLQACEFKTNYQNHSNLNQESNSSSLETLDDQDYNIQTIMMFLWPKDLSRDDVQKVQSIISASRVISYSNDLYLQNKNRISRSYDDLDCDCHLLMLCMEGDPEPELEQSCEKLTQEELGNNDNLLAVTGAYEKIKTNLNLINARNIDLGMDDDLPNIGKINLKSEKIELNNVAVHKDNTITLGNLFKLGRAGSYLLEVRIADDFFTSELSATVKSHSIVFQGDLRSSSGEEGLIYWEVYK